MRFSAWLNSSPAKVTTKLVASPHYSYCILHAICNILAAGCCTSSSFRIVAASLVTKVLSMWLTTIFFNAKLLQIRVKIRNFALKFQVESDLPLGPNDRLIFALIYLQALIFLRTTYSKPEKCLCPWFRCKVYLFQKVVETVGSVQHELWWALLIFII